MNFIDQKIKQITDLAITHGLIVKTDTEGKEIRLYFEIPYNQFKTNFMSLFKSGKFNICLVWGIHPIKPGYSWDLGESDYDIKTITVHRKHPEILDIDLEKLEKLIIRINKNKDVLAQKMVINDIQVAQNSLKNQLMKENDNE